MISFPYTDKESYRQDCMTGWSYRPITKEEGKEGDGEICRKLYSVNDIYNNDCKY